MATHSSMLAWEIPWTEEVGRIQVIRLQRVRYDLATEHTRTLQLLKPAWLEAVLHKRSHCSEKPLLKRATVTREQPPFAASRERPRAATKAQCSHKQTNKILKKQEGRLSSTHASLPVCHGSSAAAACLL